MAAFRPRMRTQREGIEVIEGVHRAFEGGYVDVWRASCAGGAAGQYVSDDPRLFVVLDPLAAPMAFRDNGRRVSSSSARSVSFIPPGAALASEIAGATEIRHLDVHFSAERYGRLFDGAALLTPRLMVEDERALVLARLLAEECVSATPLSRLYGDSLTLALLAAALGSEAPPPQRRSQLPPRVLKRLTDHIEDHCLRPIRLQELADLVGLSPSYLSHAFKAATGMPPHRYQMTARIRRACAMLTATDLPLSEIADRAGFSDQPHFTRVFRKLTGRTPAAWRGEPGCGAKSRTAAPRWAAAGVKRQA